MKTSLIVLVYAALTAFAAGVLGQSMSIPIASEASLENAFAAALRNLERERKTNRAYDLPCTHFFSAFHRYEQIEPYIAVFRKIGIPAIAEEANRKHFVSFELSSEQLSSQGYKNFRQDDRLVIVFTVASAASGEIITFRAIVSGRDMP